MVVCQYGSIRPHIMKIINSIRVRAEGKGFLLCGGSPVGKREFIVDHHNVHCMHLGKHCFRNSAFYVSAPLFQISHDRIGIIHQNIPCKPDCHFVLTGSFPGIDFILLHILRVCKNITIPCRHCGLGSGLLLFPLGIISRGIFAGNTLPKKSIFLLSFFWQSRRPRYRLCPLIFQRLFIRPEFKEQHPQNPCRNHKYKSC